VFIPVDADHSFFHGTLLAELVKGNILNDTKSKLLEIASKMNKEHGIQGLILWGAGLCLILQNDNAPGIHIIDTTDAHVENIFEALK